MYRFVLIFLAAFVVTLPFEAPCSDPSAGGRTINLPLPGERFLIQGHTAWVMVPAHRQKDQATPWIFYAHTLPGGNPRPVHAGMFQKFLDAGIAIAGIDVGESYGNPRGRELFSVLYTTLVQTRGFSARPCLLGQSRGGLQIYNWATEHTDAVACIAGIYPVSDLRKYPGISKAAPAYGMTPKQLSANLAAHNPIEKLSVLAKAHIPMLIIHGDDDTIVPLHDHSEPFVKRYREAGGEIQLFVITGQGHTLWPGWFQHQQLIEFLITHALKSSTS